MKNADKGVARAQPHRPLHIGLCLLVSAEGIFGDGPIYQKPDVIRIDGETGVGGAEGLDPSEQPGCASPTLSLLPAAIWQRTRHVGRKLQRGRGISLLPDRVARPMPANVLCTYAETSALINGLDIDGLTEKRPSLLEACDLFGIERMDKERKDAVRDLILEKVRPNTHPRSGR